MYAYLVLPALNKTKIVIIFSMADISKHMFWKFKFKNDERRMKLILKFKLQCLKLVVLISAEIFKRDSLTFRPGTSVILFLSPMSNFLGNNSR